MTTALILVGGRSRRMGADKATRPFRGRPLLPDLVARLHTRFDRVLLVGRPEQTWPELERLVDAAPDQGPLGGLLTGLRATGSRCFLVGCDHPLLDVDFARWLFDQPGDAVIPRLDGEEQPLHAVYDPSCVPAITAALADGQRAMRGGWRAAVDARWHPGPWTSTQAASMRSANTPEAWAALEREETTWTSTA